MKRILLSMIAGLVSATIAWGAGINYNGTNLQENTEFTRSQCGTQLKNTMKEISGLACSRTTPGYLWAHGDENTGDNRKIIAIQPSGTLAMTVNLTTPNTDRDDWEDIATGVYNGKNYVFVGAIGDNDKQYNDQYYIYYFEEPAISSGLQTVTVNTIRFGYPDNQAHNTETLMYDNVEQMFYIADKADGVCHLYKLPFRTDYGSGVQRLTEVCALGNGSKFKEANGGDISPDGRWMAIKNEKYVLLWERQGSESLSVTAQRDPVQVKAYSEEEQGESLAWKDATTFYTTSDSKKDTPIYQYVREGDPTKVVVTGISVNGQALEGFSADKLNYSVELPYGTTAMPTIAAIVAEGTTAQVHLPLSIPGDATVVCTSKDGSKSVTYTIHLTISATPSTDATLKSLSVNGTPVEGFQSNKYAYSMTIAYTAELPVVTAETNDAFATATIQNVTEVTKAGNDAKVIVTAQDGSTKLTYTITFKRADAIKKLNEVIMSNRYSAFIPEMDSSRIQAYYLAGEAEPTVLSHKEGEGTTWSQSGNVITLTGADGETISYNLVVEAVTPVAFTTDKIVFSGSNEESSWIKSAYGWGENKGGWKFSKTDNDYTREMNGKTHVELFLPACDTLFLAAGNSGTERDVRFYINGVEFGSKTKLLKAGITLAVNQSAPFMLTIASAQSSGDGGIATIRMARKAGSTQGLDGVSDGGVQCTKVLMDGQLYLKNDKVLYTVQGQRVK